MAARSCPKTPKLQNPKLPAVGRQEWAQEAWRASALGMAFQARRVLAGATLLAHGADPGLCHFAKMAQQLRRPACALTLASTSTRKQALNSEGLGSTSTAITRAASAKPSTPTKPTKPMLLTKQSRKVKQGRLVNFSTVAEAQRTR